MTRILVTGGTGTLGRPVVSGLLRAGTDVRVLSREQPPVEEAVDGVEYMTGDIAAGERIGSATAGAEVVVHLAGSAKGDDVKARHVAEAVSRARPRHLVFMSVVGADRIPIRSAIDRAAFGYFGAKRAAEELMRSAGVPWTILRATQFHQLTYKTIEQLSRMPVILVPSRTRFQPIDAEEVAERMTEVALGEPSGFVPEMGGPRAYGMDELVRSYLEASGKHRPIVRMRVPGDAAEAIREGANLNLERAVGRRSWEEFLAEKDRASISV